MGFALGCGAGAAALGCGGGGLLVLALGAALAAAPAAASACACKRAMFIMRTSLTKLAMVTSGNLNAGMAPLPSLMVAAIC